MTSSLTQYVLMGIFFAAILAIPAGLYLLGIKSYGTGDYHQP